MGQCVGQCTLGGWGKVGKSFLLSTMYVFPLSKVQQKFLFYCLTSRSFWCVKCVLLISNECIFFLKLLLLFHRNEKCWYMWSRALKNVYTLWLRNFTVGNHPQNMTFVCRYVLLDFYTTKKLGKTLRYRYVIVLCNY